MDVSSDAVDDASDTFFFLPIFDHVFRVVHNWLKKAYWTNIHLAI